MIRAIFKREFMGYFRTPVAYVFLSVFLVAVIGLPWTIGNFFQSDDASLRLFFQFLPWVYLFLIPAVGMRLWSEEKRSGTVELLLTFPVKTWEAVAGKFLAGWAFIVVALSGTLTMPLTIAYLGSPDWGPILSGYLGAVLMAGSYLGISSLASSLTRNQVIAFVISVVICLGLVLSGWSVFNQLLLSMNIPINWVDAIANFSFVTRFENMVQGLVMVRDILFFLTLMVFSLGATILILQR